jgi:two-component system, cell cycle sensor histidine kinase and response regulator CckA
MFASVARYLVSNARAIALVILSFLILGIHFGLLISLIGLGKQDCVILCAVCLFSLVVFMALSFSNNSRLVQALDQHQQDIVANSELLQELQMQRDHLATTMAEQAQRNIRLRLLESAVVHARDAVIILEAEPSGEYGRSVIYVNEAFTHITGYSQDEVIGRSLHFLRGPRSNGQTLDRLRQALNTNTVLQTELLNYRKDGSEVWVELNLVPVYENQDSGAVAHWVMIQRDATDRKRAEVALRISEQRLRAIYDNTNTGVAVVRPDGNILEVNPAFCRMLGYEASELTQQNVVKLTHVDDIGTQSELFAKVQAGQLTHYNIQKRYLHKHGSVVWADLHCHVLKDVAGEPVSVIGVVLDITDRKHAQEALRKSEERYRWLFDFSPQPMCVVDKLSLRFLAVNEAAILKYGYSREHFLAGHLTDLSDSQDRETLRQRLHKVIAGTVDRELWVQHTKSGAQLHVEVTANDLPSYSGASTASLMLLTDVTEKQRLEEQLRQAQKMEAIGQLAGGIAHDFNNLLTGIVGNLALIDLPVEDSNRQLVSTAEKAAQRAAELTRKLLGFARRNQVLLSPLAVSDFFNEVIGFLRRIFDPRIEIVSQVAVQEPILADATLMNQALLNLCINSRDAMPQGGRLTLKAELIDVTNELLKRMPEGRTGSFVRILVEDTGSGMTPEVRKRIFEPFFTTKPIGQGTGLGLPMVHGILKQHQGWVSLESSPNQGTRFALYLPRINHRSGEGSATFRRTLTQREVPLDTLTPRPLRRTLASQNHVGAKQKILLVDDEEMIRDIARLTLESAGYQVKECCDGQQAIEVFREDHQTIDLVLLDLTMPRLSGRDAFNQMIALNPTARIMFASGYSTDDLSDLSGAIGLLPKPYRPQDLLQAVNKALKPVLASNVPS